ncbi:NAD(P)-binding domain-containing protein [Actinoplanes sp. RD1]|uniref:NAD(P)-binding domain-containing protein n=1 Tax=Actinoplanes sp. RD1 TaxID=3064538 RepID=UPI00274153A0|nr:NAD(P)-binding domain-containing protein [Actinoplanes sp. RD1]
MSSDTVALAGLGAMGSGMAHALLAAGFPVVVHNRTPERAAPLAAAGARVAATAGEAAAAAGVVVLSLSDEEAVEDVLFARMVPRMAPGTIVVDTSTVSPDWSRRAGERLAARGVRRVEACVVGNPGMARAGKLRVLVAGDPADAEAVRPVLDAIGEQVRHLGAAGNAAVLKLVLNVQLGVQVNALAEGVALAEAAGLDRDDVLGAVAGSGFSSPVLAFRAELMRRRAYAPAAFRTSLMRKDLRLAVDHARTAGVAMPVTSRSADRFAEVVAAGRGDDDAAVLAEVPPGGTPQTTVRSGGIMTAIADNATPADLIELGTAFCRAKVVLSALELRLFAHLQDGPRTEEELRAALGLHGRGTRDFLDVLVVLGLLRRVDGGYANAPAAARWLVHGTPSYVGGFLERADHMLYPAWGRLTEALRTGAPQAEADYMDMIGHPDRLRRFVGMMDALNGLIAPELADAFDFSATTTLMDVGGARGNLVCGVLKAHPHLKGRVFDLPPMHPLFDEHVAALGLGDRAEFVEGNFFHDDLPTADTISIGHVLHDWAPEERQMLIGKAYAALPPGGTLLVYDRMVAEEPADPVNLVISLDMLLTTKGGAEYTAAECAGWMTAAGFAATEARPLGEYDTLVVGRKH